AAEPAAPVMLPWCRKPSASGAASDVVIPSAVPEFRGLVEHLAADRGEAVELLVDSRVQREHGHPMAVLEGEPHTEVPLQRAAYGVTRERAQQLPACLLVRRG